MTIEFVKMHGIGNDFVLIDAVAAGRPPGSLSDLSRRMNDRKFGAGGDGLIVMERGAAAPFRMTMLNPDGSESEMCGNGIRCFAKLLKDHGHLAENHVEVETGAGILHLDLLADGRVRVNMGAPRLTRGEIGMVGEPGDRFVDEPVGLETSWRGTAVSMGNPHLVVFVDDVSSIDLGRVGPQLETHPLFPSRVNVHFVEVASRRRLIQRTWERGAGETLACGTGACAVAVAAHLTDRGDSAVQVDLPGGTLEVEVSTSGNVFMTGPAATVYRGVWQT